MFPLAHTLSYSDPNEKQLQDLRLTSNNELINSTAGIIIVFLDVVFNEDVDQRDRYNITQFQDLSDSVKTFGDADICIKYLAKLKHETVFMIISCMFGESIITAIHDMSQLQTICIFCKQPDMHYHLLGNQRKVKGNFSEINKIYEYTKGNIERREMDLISFKILSSTTTPQRGLNQLDQSFMYSQLLKKIILEIEYDDKAKIEFIKSLQEEYANNDKCLSVIRTFEHDYKKDFARFWYSKESFIYAKVNKALRTQDTDTLIKMGFFIKDLHQEIKNNRIDPKSNKYQTVYRGQGITNDEFKQMENSIGCLLSFNCFLSTTADISVAYTIAESNADNPEMTGILFCIDIDRSISSVYFTDLEDTSNYKTENEILFSMHSVFRIDKLEKLKNQIWEIHIKLTDDDDEQLRNLTEYMRKELLISTGWKALGILLTKIGHFDGAIGIFQKLIDSTPKNNWEALADLHNSMGVANIHKGIFTEAIGNIEKAIEFSSKSNPPCDDILIAAYSNLGETYRQAKKYSEAIIYLQYVSDNCEKKAHANRTIYAGALHNIGLIHITLKNYTTALEYFERALQVQNDSLPPSHPDLAYTHANIGDTQKDLGEPLKALMSYEKALSIQENALPADHPHLGITYGKISILYQSMKKYTEALQFAEKSQAVFLQSSRPIYSNLGTIYSIIGQICYSLEKYTDALSNFNKYLEIEKKIDSLNGSRLTEIYQQIGYVYQLLGKYSDALSFYNNALENHRKSKSTDQERLVDMYTCIGYVHMLLHTYEDALSNLEEARQISETFLPSNNLFLSAILNQLGQVHESKKSYSAAIDFYEKALKIQQEFAPDDQNIIARCYICIGNIHDKLKNFPKALSYYNKALEAKKTITPDDDSILARIHCNIATVHEEQKKYDLALSSYHKAVRTEEDRASPNPSVFYYIYQNIVQIHQLKGDNQTALSFCRKILVVEKKIPSINPLKQAGVYNNIAFVYCSTGNHQAALDLLEKVQKIQQEHQQINHSLVYATHMNFHNALRGLQRHPEANEHAERAREIAREHPELANFME